MTDRLSPEARSALMSGIRSEGTGPELFLRRALHAAGLRFRVCVRGLPGSPDVVFPGRRLAVFVHGCFWHSCRCRKGRLPKSDAAYWRAKLARNRWRDRRAAALLRGMGWSILVVRECELADGAGAAVSRIVSELSRARAEPEQENAGTAARPDNGKRR